MAQNGYSVRVIFRSNGSMFVESKPAALLCSLPIVRRWGLRSLHRRWIIFVSMPQVSRRSSEAYSPRRIVNPLIWISFGSPGSSLFAIQRTELN
jgi:hypothetical protein